MAKEFAVSAYIVIFFQPPMRTDRVVRAAVEKFETYGKSFQMPTKDKLPMQTRALVVNVSVIK